jgi:hypothetical protein
MQQPLETSLLQRIEQLKLERDDAREQRRKWQEASAADRAENARLRREIQTLRNTMDRLLKIEET